MHKTGTYRSGRTAGRALSFLLLVMLLGNVVLSSLSAYSPDLIGQEWIELLELEHEGKDHSDSNEVDKYEAPVAGKLQLRFYLSGSVNSLKRSTVLEPVGFIEIFSPPPERASHLL